MTANNPRAKQCQATKKNGQQCAVFTQSRYNDLIACSWDHLEQLEAHPPARRLRSPQ